MEELEDNVELYPPWKEALKAFEREGFSYGDLITRDWFSRAIGIAPPADDARLTLRELNRYELTLLNQFQPFRRAILEKFQMDLVSDRAGAYLIIAPKDQPDRAWRDLESGIKREFERALARIKNVNTARLTTEERQQAMDTYAKAADLASRMVVKRRQLPLDGED
jgi:hypothetical protein